MVNEYQWVSDIRLSISSYLKRKIPQEFPKANVTNKSKDLSEPTFPTVYFHALPWTEIGQDLEAQTINGINMSYQIDVITNTSQEDADKIMTFVMGLFKRLRFELYSFPSFESNGNGDIYRTTARVRRVFGADDTL